MSTACWYVLVSIIESTYSYRFTPVSRCLTVPVTAFQKCDALSGGPELSVDDRSFGMLSLSSMDVKSSQAYLYPRLLPVHDLDIAEDSDTIPVAMRASVDKLREHGAYILENGILMFLYVGLQVGDQLRLALNHSVYGPAQSICPCNPKHRRPS